MPSQRGNTVMIVVVVVVLLVLTCGLCGVLGLFGRGGPSSEGPALVPALTLMAAGGSEAELSDALAILERRLQAAGIPHAIDRHELKFSVRLPEDSAQVREAQRLLLAGGELHFKLIVGVGEGRKQLPEERWDAELEKVQAAKKRGSYDPATFAYDMGLQYDFLPRLLENPGFPGYHVEKARYLWVDAGGEQRRATQLGAAAAKGSQALLLTSARGVAPGQMLRLGPQPATHHENIVRVEAVRGDSVDLAAPLARSVRDGAQVVRGFFEIRYQMTPEGAKAYRDYARQASGLPEATLLDGEIVTVATWGEVGPETQIDPAAEWTFSNTSDETPWSEEDARYFSTLMSGGRLPVELTLEYE